MTNYDIILVLEYFRTVPYYLSIIKYLKKNYKIGVYQVELEPELMRKNKKAQKYFIKLCNEMGADIVIKKKITTDLLIIPQRTYLKIAQDDIHTNIISKMNIGVLTLAWAGFKNADNFIKQFKIQKLLTIDLSFIQFLLEARDKKDQYTNYDIIEVGYPYKKYPVFEDFKADYMLATPTPFSFAHERDKWSFLETVIRILEKIDDNDFVVFKSHNAIDKEQLASSKLFKIAKLINKSRFLTDIIISNIRRESLVEQKFIGRIYTAMLFMKVMEKVTPFESLNSSHQVGMEAFLPGVKKGVIGGLSNSIHATLYSKLPYYNCVDLIAQDRNANNKLYEGKKPSTTIELNLKFFGVPYCEGELEFDQTNFNIISDSTQKADLILEIKKAISEVENLSSNNKLETN